VIIEDDSSTKWTTETYAKYNDLKLANAIVKEVTEKIYQVKNTNLGGISMNTLLNGVAGILIQAIYTIVGVATTYLISVLVSYLNKKKQSEIIKIGADEYNSRVTVAKGIFYQVEQLFKLIPGSGELKATVFDKLLLAKFPTLTQSQLDHFRESVCGEINLQVTTLLAPVHDPVKDKANIKGEAESTPIVTDKSLPGKTQA